jgi:D-tyrosyl-tRNA(Tyr) deacylase
VRAILQRVREASVDLGESEIARIGPGLLILVGFEQQDTPALIPLFVRRVTQLRTFRQASRHFEVSLLEVNGSVLLVSQFTLLANTKKGHRPDFSRALPAAQAAPLFDSLYEAFQKTGTATQRGIFGADLSVHLINDGPVTYIIELPD